MTLWEVSTEHIPEKSFSAANSRRGIALVLSAFSKAVMVRISDLESNDCLPLLESPPDLNVVAAENALGLLARSSLTVMPMPPVA